MQSARSLLHVLRSPPRWSRFWRDERGVSTTEYGLMIAGFVCVIIAALTLSGTSIADRFNFIANVLRSS